MRNQMKSVYNNTFSNFTSDFFCANFNKYSHEYRFCILFQITVKGNEQSWNNGDGDSPYAISSAIH